MSPFEVMVLLFVLALLAAGEGRRAGDIVWRVLSYSLAVLALGAAAYHLVQWVS